MMEEEGVTLPSGESRNETITSSGGSDIDSDQKTSASGTRFSNEYRHQLVAALKRRLKRPTDEPALDSVTDADESFGYGDVYGHHGGKSPSHPNQENVGVSAHNRMRPQSAPDQRPSPSKSQQYHEEQSSPQPQYPILDPFAGRMMSMDEDANVVNARTTRIAQAESAIRQEMFKECTFKPVITKLPRSYGGGGSKDNTPFYSRVMRWQKDKEMEAKRRVEMHRENEVTDCTFKPQINKNSERAAKDSRNQVSKHGLSVTGMPIGNESGPAAGGAAAGKRKSTKGEISANERLYRAGEMLEEQRRMAVEETQRLQAEQERADTEYHIHRATNSKYQAVGPRVYNNLLNNNPNVDAYGGSRSATPAKDPSCSFTPKVKGVSSSMSAAKQYLSTNVVDRLTRPQVQKEPQHSVDDDYVLNSSMMRNKNGGAPGTGGVMDVASFMNSLGGPGGMPYNTPGAHSVSAGRPQSAPKERPIYDNGSVASSGGSVVTSNSMSPQERAAKQQRFKEFLARQSQSVKRKDHHVQDAMRATTPNFKPELCKRSLNLTETHVKGSFLERLSRDVVSRRNKETKQDQTPVKDSNCSFKPQILAKSENLRGRSVYEMSRGDMLKRESNQKMNKLRSEQEQLAEVTFHPVISKYAAEKSHSKSLLNTNKNPNEFLEHYHREQEKKKSQRQEAALVRQQQEEEGCTFKPKTVPCPAYIKRIAKSMQVVKASRRLSESAASKDQRPPSTWR